MESTPNAISHTLLPNKGGFIIGKVKKDDGMMLRGSGFLLFWGIDIRGNRAQDGVILVYEVTEQGDPCPSAEFLYYLGNGSMI